MKLLEDGTCKDCENYTRTSANLKACEEPICGDREKIEKNGNCKKCDDFQTLSTDKKTCYMKTCGP
jgi:hypothetical protein